MPVLEDPIILGSGNGKDVREILEVSCIEKKVQDCVSEASKALYEREFDYVTSGL